jgi:hypothetical protein
VDDHRLHERLGHGEAPGEKLTVECGAFKAAEEGLGKGTRPKSSVHDLEVSKRPEECRSGTRPDRAEFYAARLPSAQAGPWKILRGRHVEPAMFTCWRATLT